VRDFSLRKGFGATALVAVAACAPHSSVVQEEGDAGEVMLLPDPDGGTVTWKGWTGAFVGDYCVQCHSPSAPCGGSGCHPSAGELPDFREREAVVAFAQTIECGICVQQDPTWQCAGVTPKEFPVDEGNNPLPTSEQRALVVDWIEAGCP
jgi:hypothetical protein